MFILKSRSPRRIEILKNLGLNFQIEPSDIDEMQLESEAPLGYLERMVRTKIGQPLSLKSQHLYLSCDTIVVIDDKILHKPATDAEAMETLAILNGRIHRVYSGCMLVQGAEWDFFFEETQIEFKNWDDQDRRDYVVEQKPYDKAGSYGIQDYGTPVLKWVGSYHNVLGFPLRGFLKRWVVWNAYLFLGVYCLKLSVYVY